MRTKNPILIIITLFILLFPTYTAFAQSGTTSGEEPATVQTLKATGVIVNQSPGSAVPESVEIMLHIWDQNFMSKGMIHGQSLQDGSFEIDEVPLEPGSIYAVMAVYEGATYISDQILLESADTPLDFEVPIYESTSDNSGVFAEQAHVLFSFDQGGLHVWEVYILTNPGEYTLKDAVSLEDGQTATFRFSLPNDAANLSFETNDEGRFLTFPGGYADTAPLTPGKASNQILVSYVLPYEDRQTYTFNAPFKVNGVRFLVVDDPGIALEGENLAADGSQTMQDGTKFLVFSRDEVPANESVDVVISGKPENPGSQPQNAGTSTTPTKQSSNLEIGIGALALGLALVGAGIWWWRKPEKEPDDDADYVLEDPEFKILVQEIVELDDRYHKGEIGAKKYKHLRQALVTRGKNLLLEDTPESYAEEPVKEPENGDGGCCG